MVLGGYEKGVGITPTPLPFEIGLVPTTVLPSALTLSATATATATWPVRLGPSLVHREVASIESGSIKSFNGFLRLLGGAHCYESKTTRTTAHAIGHQVGFDNGTMRGKRVLQVVFSGIEGKISYKYFCVHVILCP